MTEPDGGAYKGSVWRPSNDNSYVGKMTLGELSCARQAWTRID